jgi:tetratricopeptide (TPR) repeat protein
VDKGIFKMMKRKSLLILSSGVCLLFALFSGCGGNPGEKEYNKARSSWKKNNLARAQSQMEKAIRKMSDNEKKSVANNQLGIIRWRLGKQDQAIESFAESCRLAEDLSGANLNLGVALYHVGQWDQAKFQLTNVLIEEPENAVARIYLGLVNMEEQDWQGASKELAEGLRSRPNDAAGQNALALAELHLNRGSDAAIKRLKQLLVAYPDYAPAAYNLAMIYEQWLKEPRTALGWFRQYLQKAGDDGEQAETARQAVERLNRMGPDAPKTTTTKTSDPTAATQYIAEGTKLHGRKKYSEAVKVYEKAIEADPSLADAHYNLGLTYYELKEYRQGMEAFSDALELNANYANARYMIALAYGRLDEWNNAEREAKALKKVDEERGDALLKYISDARK